MSGGVIVTYLLFSVVGLRVPGFVLCEATLEREMRTWAWPERSP